MGQLGDIFVISLPLHCDVSRPISVQNCFVYCFLSVQLLTTFGSEHFVLISLFLNIIRKTFLQLVRGEDIE